jgi:hypothetical protein
MKGFQEHVSTLRTSDLVASIKIFPSVFLTTSINGLLNLETALMRPRSF